MQFFKISVPHGHGPKILEFCQRDKSAMRYGQLRIVSCYYNGGADVLDFRAPDGNEIMPQLFELGKRHGLKLGKENQRPQAAPPKPEQEEPVYIASIHQKTFLDYQAKFKANVVQPFHESCKMKWIRHYKKGSIVELSADTWPHLAYFIDCVSYIDGLTRRRSTNK